MKPQEDGKKSRRASPADYIKQMNLTIHDSAGLLPIAHALSSELRLNILSLTGRQTMSVGELARALDVPVSTIAVNVTVLENAGLLTTRQVPGTRGMQRKCTKVTDYVSVNLTDAAAQDELIGEIRMPVGGYSLCGDILPTCGLANEKGFIGVQDQPLNFYLPERFGAQLLWFRQGFVEYRFPVEKLRNARLQKIMFVFEACSEAIGYDNHCVSDIFVEAGGLPIGVWHSPGDFGGRRGLLNPEWWPSFSSQYGLLKSWSIDSSGSYLDDQKISDVTLGDLNLAQAEYLSLRIGVRPDAQARGGLNLFGAHFGDFPVDILLRYWIADSSISFA